CKNEKIECSFRPEISGGSHVRLTIASYQDHRDLIIFTCVGPALKIPLLAIFDKFDYHVKNFMD
ncbi:hypothetical protein, partial [Desulfobacula sp.]|uniref:hypothetical protein n=1 Tax=Desulfobacula sp. TaxID=2593537 RepID=UPI002615713C